MKEQGSGARGQGSGIAELTEVLERLVDDCEGYTTGTGCVGCAGEPDRDEETNEEIIDHEPDCTIVKAKAIIREAKKRIEASSLGFDLAERILKLKWGTNVMSEKLCPICRYPTKHKRGCPYPLAEKLVKKATGKPPSPQPSPARGEGERTAP